VATQEIESLDDALFYASVSEQKLDLLPSATTIKPFFEDIISSMPRELLDIPGARMIGELRDFSSEYDLHNSFMLNFAAVFSTSLTAATNNRAGFWERIAEEEKKYFCGRLLFSALCYPFFKTTMEHFRPFLPRESIVVQPEVRTQMENDPFLRRLIDVSVVESINVLRNEDTYFLDVFEENDFEVPTWKENILRVRIAKGSFENKMRLWETLEEKIRTKIREIRKQVSRSERRKIDSLNERLSIRVEEMS
jgi:hypothetical protein